MSWNAFRKTKAFDLLMAAPLIAWFGYNAFKVRPTLARDAAIMVAGHADVLTVLQFCALFASVTFDLLLVWLLLARSLPLKKSQGLVPRLCGQERNTPAPAPGCLSTTGAAAGICSRSPINEVTIAFRCLDGFF